MRDIKIFVSHRIEFDSRMIDNPLFYPVRCGAVDDHRTGHKIPGDDTGDNISSYRVSLGEFTVMYWAWKNIKADYYGIYHYRRYFSFSPRLYKNTEHDQIRDPFPDNRAIKRYCLKDEQRMRDIIGAHDAIVNKTTSVHGFDFKSRPADTVYDRWLSWGIIEKSSLDLLLELIGKMRPEYLQSARDYLFGNRHRGNNCFIFSRDLFFRYCDFVFDIMFESEKRLVAGGGNKRFPRTTSFLGEIMYGIFILHLQKQNKFRIKELQLVFFEQTRQSEEDLFHIFRRTIRRSSLTLLPLGSVRREKLKRFYYAIKSDTQTTLNPITD